MKRVGGIVLGLVLVIGFLPGAAGAWGEKVIIINPGHHGFRADCCVFISPGHAFRHHRFFVEQRFFEERFASPFVVVDPTPQFIWVPSFWWWNGFQWVWVPGHWANP